MKSAICLIARNEAPDIAEWLVHHALVGFDRIVLYDNASDDGMERVVDALAGLLPIEYRRWPRLGGENPQLTAYADCVARLAGEVDWVAFLDADEFLIPPPGESVADLLATHEADTCFALNWLVFGSAGVERLGSALVTETFLYRAPVAFGPNHHVKSFVRPDHVVEVVNPHFIRTTRPYRDVAGELVAWGEVQGVVAPGTVVAGAWRLHHYFVRSREHWRRRMARGTVDASTRLDEAWEANDRNEVYDGAALPAAARVRAWLDGAAARAALATAGLDLPHHRDLPTTPPPGQRRSPAVLTLDACSAEGASGWGYNPAHADIPLRLRFEGAGRTIELRCDRPRPDVQAGGHPTASCGFEVSFGTMFRQPGAHVLRALSLTGQPIPMLFDGRYHEALSVPGPSLRQDGAEQPPGPEEAGPEDAGPEDAELGQAGPEEAGEHVHLVLDQCDQGVVTGWGLDYLSPQQPLAFGLLIDGALVAELRCTGLRPDVRLSGVPSDVVGFRHEIDARFLDGEPHAITARSLAGEPIPLRSGDAVHGGGVVFRQRRTARLLSSVDEFDSNVVRGWVVREELGSGEYRGGCIVLARCNGVPAGTVRADEARPDVAANLGCDPQCGFRFTLPEAFRRPYAQEISFFLAPGEVELANSPITVSFITERMELRLRSVLESADALYAEIGRLRAGLMAMLPHRGYALDEYDGWARAYQAALHGRVGDLRSRAGVVDGGLVSVLMPVYRPELAHFQAAVESVLRQGYARWELIIADDGSQQPELTRTIEGYAARDRRIRVAPMARNGGISRATNAALALAEGDWIVFFDHDDLLDPVALEVMMLEAARTGARLLYSDEDKIDALGRFVEPAFKTGWNYRLLLGVNYVCHLVCLRAEVARAVGELRAQHDGAQDHDYLLRASEVLAPGEIHHVAHVLYHWRISAGSTAASTEAKSYAVSAGLAAVQAHLERRGLQARVSQVAGRTFYDVAFPLAATPLVSIIIPFRDGVAMTRACVEATLRLTDYPRYEIILVDNWSVSEAAAAFVREVTADPRVRVLRVEEEFNYSRLNNLAAASTDAAFLVPMNNDLFVTSPDWLQVLLGEAQADPRVGIVGGKFLYPNGSIQHGGVVLGIGGVAGHSHSHLPADAYGYAGRLLFAQEMSAVTAACMLVRADAFRAVKGFDERDLKVAFNDVDLCLKVRHAGYTVIWTPGFVAEHHESVSRGSDQRPERERMFFREMQVMRRRWGDVLDRDPFYSPHFTLDRRPFIDLNDPEASALTLAAPA